ncbi:unnamed protein product [Clavelina lepadiformis]|uniref:Uncharacterized protein n=1 Tax=Clavelina lepadiformis TaxID=159417 RepID=A0ABP0H3X2_CLALP
MSVSAGKMPRLINGVHLALDSGFFKKVLLMRFDEKMLLLFYTKKCDQFFTPTLFNNLKVFSFCRILEHDGTFARLIGFTVSYNPETPLTRHFMTKQCGPD